jgi:hypothetical protein
VDHIILGGGPSGASGSRSTFPGHHAASFLSLNSQGLQGKTSLRPGPCQSNLPIRYREVGLSQFAQMKNICVACDGSRVGGQEILQILLLGRTRCRLGRSGMPAW